MSGPADKRHTLLRGAYSAVVVAAIAVVSWYVLSRLWRFTIDDAGISYAYAKHLAQGEGPVAAPGAAKVEGYSNPLWVLWLVPPAWLGLPLGESSKWLGVALAAGVVVAATGLGRRIADLRPPYFGALSLSIAILLVATPEFSVWVVAGLENTLFSFLLLATLWASAREEVDPSLLGWSGLVAFLASVTRPEGIAYALPWALAKAWQALVRPAYRYQVATAALLLLGPFLAYHAIHYSVFRQVVPNTFFAKSAASGIEGGVRYLRENLAESGFLYLVPVSAFGLLGAPRFRLLLLSHALLSASFVIYAGGDWMPHGRFISFALPHLALLAALGLVNAARWLSRAAALVLPQRFAWGVEPWVLLLATTLSLRVWGFQQSRIDRIARRPWCHLCERSAQVQRLQRLQRRAALGLTSLLTHDFGGPALRSTASFTPIDFLGLCDLAAARLERRAGPRSSDHRLQQYFFHEQPDRPGLYYLPENFWRHIRTSLEFREEYVRLSSGLLGRGVSASDTLALHRGQLVDFFPPLESFEFRPLSPWLRLLGSRIEAPMEGGGPLYAGTPLRVVAYVLPVGELLGSEEVRIRVTGSSEPVESSGLSLSRNLASVSRHLHPGEPLEVQADLVLPRAKGGRYGLELGLRRPGSGPGASADWQWVEVRSLQEGARPRPAEHRLPRYPSALPPPKTAELRALALEARGVVEHRRLRKDARIRDPELSERLLELARRLRSAGATEQEYLALILATHADPDAWQKAVTRVTEIRPLADAASLGLTVELLRDYYRTGSASALARLIAFQLSRGRLAEASFFFRRWPDDAEPSGVRAALALALDRGLAGEPVGDALEWVARDPLGGALDFESTEKAGWDWNGMRVSVGPWPIREQRKNGLRGQHARGLLSTSPRHGATKPGVAEIGSFEIRGERLSLLVGGGRVKDRVGVELWVEGERVRRAGGPGRSTLLPHLWDISDFQGQRAELRIVDRSRRARVLLDYVLMWK